ncbi:hypothetical protein ARMGADRAFT_1070389 [Armillaria gallica]|uniref:Uncharacterized protein n=1 Tax=Armillaria gallica TaxID=47427 RepID=A0A2H3EZT2_ARMGA|nr:hypothetical protein ARMGADRAFT_1070389 [Armillaria gallica]
MSDARPLTKNIHIPTELIDKIINLKIENSPMAHADAESLSVSHPQFQDRAQAVLIADIYISHCYYCHHPIRFFTHASHLIRHVHMIHILGDKDQWEDQFPVIITMLTTGERCATKIVLEKVDIGDLLALRTNWENFMDTTISDSVFIFNQCLQWVKELRNLQSLTFTWDHPNICQQDVVHSIPSLLPPLDALVYHPESGIVNILVNERFSACIYGLCRRLSSLQITTSSSNISGVNMTLLVCQTTLESLDIHIMGWRLNHSPPCFFLRGYTLLQSLTFWASERYAARITSSLDSVAVDNILTSSMSIW